MPNTSQSFGKSQSQKAKLRDVDATIHAADWENPRVLLSHVLVSRVLFGHVLLGMRNRIM